MGLEAADVGDEVVDFLLRGRKTAHTAVGLGEKGCEPVVGPATSRAIVGNGGAASLVRPPSTRWHWAHRRLAISLPETGSPAAWTEPFAITKAPLSAIIAQTLSRGRHMIVRV